MQSQSPIARNNLGIYISRVAALPGLRSNNSVHYLESNYNSRRRRVVIVVDSVRQFTKKANPPRGKIREDISFPRYRDKTFPIGSSNENGTRDKMSM